MGLSMGTHPGGLQPKLLVKKLGKAELPLSGQLKRLRLGCVCLEDLGPVTEVLRTQRAFLLPSHRGSGQRVRSTPGVCLKEESLEQIKSQFVFQCGK